MKRFFRKKCLAAVIFAAMITILGICGCTRRTAAARYPGDYETAEVNGVSICYEIVGEGDPVILLHGNGGSHEDLSLITEQLAAAGYRAYAVDSRGQGANAPLDEYHYTDMADDVYQLIKLWGLTKPALYGWSDGGIVGLLTEIRHPGSLGALAVSGANISPDGLDGSFLMSVKLSDAVHEDPLTTMILTEPDITEEELAGITCPVLVTAGSGDIIREDHTRQIAEAIPGSQLIIFDGESHGSYITGNTKMAEALITFLEEIKCFGFE